MNQSNSDEALIAAVVERAYEVLGFEPGAEPRWDAFAELFVDGSVLALRVFPRDASVSVLSLRGYMEAQMQHGIKEEGYSETPGARRIEICGDIATVKQDFSMNFAGRKPVSAVDVFSMARLSDRWKIVSVISDLANRDASSD